MMLMVVVVLVVVGLCLGSFVNALVWRLHEQSKNGKKDKNLSIAKGRSMCPHCRHELAANDLVPVISWLALKGRCRYCGRPISLQYPSIELAVALLFVASYVWWPQDLSSLQIAVFVLWLAFLTGLSALFIYDLRWRLLPNRIIYPLAAVAGLIAVLNLISAPDFWSALLDLLLAVIIGGGIFYALLQISGGRWIGGGDVRLGWLLGLVAGTPGRSLLFIFLGSVIGTLISLPLLYTKKLKPNSAISFGPLLIAGLIITQFFGGSIIHWYLYHFINF